MHAAWRACRQKRGASPTAMPTPAACACGRRRSASKKSTAAFCRAIHRPAAPERERRVRAVFALEQCGCFLQGDIEAYTKRNTDRQPCECACNTETASRGRVGIRIDAVFVLQRALACELFVGHPVLGI